MTQSNKICILSQVWEVPWVYGSSSGHRSKPEKIQMLLNMKSLVKVKDVQCLIGCISSLNHFIARAIDRCLPFFNALKKGSEFAWMDDCEQSL